MNEENNITDRELLELAAKGAGYGFRWLMHGSREVLRVVYSPADNPRIFNSMDWNPLNDSGDAFRLAVELDIDIIFYRGFEEVCAVNSSGSAEASEEFGENKLASTRRAIVRAAAEIGRNMP